MSIARECDSGAFFLGLPSCPLSSLSFEEHTFPINAPFRYSHNSERRGRSRSRRNVAQQIATGVQQGE